MALGLSLGPGAHHAVAQPAFAAALPREDRVAVGWMIGPGGNNSPDSDRVLEMTVFGDVPLRGSRLRVSAELARWPFTSFAYGLNGQPGLPFRDTAAVRRLLLQ